MTNISRREFIKAASISGCLLPGVGISDLSWGKNKSSDPLLLTLFLRGGADGLNMVSPVNDVNLIEARPTDLRILEAGPQAGFLLNQTQSSNLGFYLHREAAPLFELYKAKQLAIIHAVGINNATRSHEEAQSIIDRGVGNFNDKSYGQNTPGWLARAVNGQKSIQSEKFIAAYSSSTITPLCLEGINSSLVTPNINSGLHIPWGKSTVDFLKAITASTVKFNPSPIANAMNNALGMQEKINYSVQRDSTGRVLPYQASGKANYEDAGDLSNSLSSIARLAKMDVGLKVANINLGGWDTHENQSGQFAGAMRRLAKGLSAFYEDMTSSNQAVTIVVLTEFGRRVRSNKSQGTDHGHGACWFVLGDRVNGGDILGRWPGLQSGEMDQGLDLAVTTDYRQILAESMRASNLNVGEALGGWEIRSKSLGLFI